jgi:polysaccharide export outer membrane protein
MPNTAKSLLLLTLIFSVAISFELSAPLAQAQTNDIYRIGANDVLSIYVWKEEELTRDVVVMPDGNIHFPLIGELRAQGKTVGELKSEMTKNLTDYIDAPAVTVMVVDQRSQVIYTVGKLMQPGPYPLAPNMTVLQAISAAGGFTEWADTKEITIVRNKDGKQVLIPFNYNDVTSGKKIEQNITLKPGDTIVVP